MGSVKCSETVTVDVFVNPMKLYLPQYWLTSYSSSLLSAAAKYPVIRFSSTIFLECVHIDGGHCIGSDALDVCENPTHLPLVRYLKGHEFLTSRKVISLGSQKPVRHVRSLVEQEFEFLLPP